MKLTSSGSKFNFTISFIFIVLGISNTIIADGAPPNKISTKSRVPPAKIFGPIQLPGSFGIPLPMGQLHQLQRIKRDLQDTKALANIHNFFPANINDENLQKFLQLLTEPKPADSWEEACNSNGCGDDDDYVVDLMHGKQPGSLSGSRSRNGKGSEDTTAEPILLHRHRMNKKPYNSLSGSIVPDLLYGRRLTRMDPRLYRYDGGRIYDTKLLLEPFQQ